MTSDAQARLAERLRHVDPEGALKPEERAMIQQAADLLAPLELAHEATALAERDRATLQAQVEEQRKRLAIVELAVPLEEELASRIDEMCKYLAMEDGFTLNGIARLLIDCQRRMATDWDVIGQERRQRTTLQAQLGAAQEALRTFGKHVAGCKRGLVVEPVACPSCGEQMRRVRNMSGYLNDDQFDAVKIGDWFCKRHDVEVVYVWDKDLAKHDCTCGLEAAFRSAPPAQELKS